MNQVVFDSRGESDTCRLACALAEHLPAGATVELVGPLGAGKTRLVRALAECCGVPAGEVQSPTFVIVKHYHGQREICHCDLYRVRDDDELDELGWSELLETPAWKLIEWGDRFSSRLPTERLTIRVEISGRSSRAISVEATAGLIPVVDALAEKLVDLRRL